MDPSSYKTLRFLIETEIPHSRLNDLLNFIQYRYVIPLHSRFINTRRALLDGKETLTFTLFESEGPWYVDVEIIAGNPVEIKMTFETATPLWLISRLRESLLLTIQRFEDEIRKTTFYFVWVPDRNGISMRASGRRELLKCIFTGNMLLFFIIFLALSYGVFFVLIEILRMPVMYFPLTLVIVQLIMMMFSHKIVEQMGDYPITEQSPHVHILQCNFSRLEFNNVLKNYPKKTLLEIKKRIYDRTFRINKPLVGDVIKDVFYEYGIEANPENMIIKSINVYRIVKEAAERFRIRLPKITLSNIGVPNAAATGLSPRFGLILITSDLLIQLDEEEILSVICHELSHIKRRDPVALFILSSTEYLFRIYFFWHLIYFFGIFYLFLALGLIYFIAKFFESRADLDSAIAIGKPQILADALRKIGHKRIQVERILNNRVVGWLGWNPHPPISFRVERLERIRNLNEIRHPFLRSIKDCVNGLLESLL